MPKFLYLSLVRIPTEKAHGLQIVQNCEAFADAGYQVALWLPRRVNTAEMRQVPDVYRYYGVKPNFTMHYLPLLDLMPLAGGQRHLERIAFYLQVITYIVAMFVRVLFSRADIYYSRDETLLLALSFIVPRRKLVYEAHLFRASRQGGWLQGQVVRRCGSTVAITPALRDDLIAQHHADAGAVMVAHDGIRAERFQNVPSQTAARQKIGWNENAFIVGFVGRLHMLNVDKGVGLLVDALAGVDNVALALVGGPDEMAEALRNQWRAKHLPENNFLYAGHVLPDDVPLYLSAMDVCAMPHPYTEQFAKYTSPLKLFEYMAARRALVASNLPGWSDVVQDEVNALLVPPGDVTALAAAVARLREDAALRERLAGAAYMRVMAQYTWAARAQAIRAHIERENQ